MTAPNNELMEYLQSHDLDEDEYELLSDWVNEGHSVYENPEHECDPDGDELPYMKWHWRMQDTSLRNVFLRMQDNKTHHIYTERTRHSKKIRKWEYSIRVLGRKLPAEMEVSVSGMSYHLIYGKYINGYFIAMPEWHICCPASRCDDTFYNYENLLYTGIDECAAKTIAEAIKTVLSSASNSV